MADARTLLRQQRAARQQQQQKSKPQKPSAAAAPASRKRKASTEDDVEERKRTRTEEEAGLPANFFDAGVAAQEEAVPAEAAAPAVPVADPDPAPGNATAPDAELDAFMSEMEKTAETQRHIDNYSGAIIEAAPMTAAEIAAQAREEQSAQRAKQDEDLEGEHEDAERALQDEFEEMDGLEDRVRRLREKREALRIKPVPASAVDQESMLPTPQPEEEDSMSDDDEDDDDEEDWDDWRFRPA